MENRRFLVTVNGKRYEVEVEDVAPSQRNEIQSAAPAREVPAAAPPPVKEAPAPRPQPAAARKANGAGSSNELRAPLNGVVLEVFVAPGQSVKAKELLCSIEAMKMKTSIYSKTEGVVDVVHVKAGDRVETSQLLFSFS